MFESAPGAAALTAGLAIIAAVSAIAQIARAQARGEGEKAERGEDSGRMTLRELGVIDDGGSLDYDYRASRRVMEAALSSSFDEKPED